MSAPPRSRSAAGFALRFVIWTAGFALASATGTAERLVHEPLSHALARGATALLRPLGNASSAGAGLAFDGFRVQVVAACDGLQPSYLFLAAVLAWPAPARARLAAAAWGIPAILAANLLRIASLAWLGARHPGLFAGVHLYVWQGALVAIAVGLWMLWVERTEVGGITASRSPDSRDPRGTD